MQRLKYMATIVMLQWRLESEIYIKYTKTSVYVIQRDKVTCSYKT